MAYSAWAIVIGIFIALFVFIAVYVAFAPGRPRNRDTKPSQLETRFSSWLYPQIAWISGDPVLPINSFCTQLSR